MSEWKFYKHQLESSIVKAKPYYPTGEPPANPDSFPPEYMEVMITYAERLVVRIDKFFAEYELYIIDIELTPEPEPPDQRLERFEMLLAGTYEFMVFQLQSLEKAIDWLKEDCPESHVILRLRYLQEMLKLLAESFGKFDEDEEES